MANIIDYVKWRGDLSFQTSSFCEADNLVFSLICYLDFSGIAGKYPSRETLTIKELAEKYFSDGRNVKPGAIIPPEINDLFAECAASERFSAVKVSNHVNIVDKEGGIQFSATLFHLTDRSLFVAFRGTDDTLTGWKENFALSFEWAVPSQLAAADYVNKISGMFFGKIRMGGHSKGGNLAVFAAAQCKKVAFWRISDVYSNDGPGFSSTFFHSSAFSAAEHKIHTFIPESSVVGMLLEHEEEYTIVKSSSRGLLQHDALSWEILGSSFVIADELSTYARRTDKLLRTWLHSMTAEQRRSFTESFFSVLEASEAETLSEIQNSFFKKFMAMARAFRETDKETKAMLSRLLKQIFNITN